ncbi:MAG: Hpt domain-containing protein [Planctomycetia bacterium]|nr:Hpt domain-containing protein [Planctomycetia bacterium]
MPPLDAANSPAASSPATNRNVPGQASASAFDRETALRGVGGDEAFLREISQMFLDLGPNLLTKAKDTVACRDLANVKRAAHALKGAVSNLGAKAVTAAAVSLEEIAHAGNIAALDGAYAELEREVDRIRRELSDFVAGSVRQRMPAIADQG